MQRNKIPTSRYRIPLNRKCVRLILQHAVKIYSCQEVDLISAISLQMSKSTPLSTLHFPHTHIGKLDAKYHSP